MLSQNSLFSSKETKSNLLPETLKEALGNKLANRFHELVKINEGNSVQFDRELLNKYLDEVVTRYCVLNKNHYSNPIIEQKRNSYLPQLRNHVKALALIVFTKPNEITSRLKQVGYSSQEINQIQKNMNQAGHQDYESEAIGMCLFLTSETISIATSESSTGCDGTAINNAPTLPTPCYHSHYHCHCY